MVLEGLLELVKTLRARIKEHLAVLSGNEMLTRYALIDPLLRELGWDTSDPATIAPEDTSGLGRGRPDYVLLANGQPVMVIEAKKLGSGLQQGTNQAIQYAMDPNRKARYFAITDGQSWEIFDTQKPAYEMSTISFDLTASAAAEVCLKALALWHPSVAAGSVSAAQAPIVQPQDHPQEPPPEPAQPAAVYSQPVSAQSEHPRISEPPSTSEFPPSPHSHQDRATPAQPEPHPAEKSLPSVSAGEWIPLSELDVTRGDTPPVGIQFPDGNRAQTGRWNKVLVESVRWLVNNNILNENHYPIRYSRRYILADRPIHPNGNEFKYSISVGSLSVETNYSSRDCIRNSRLIIERTGHDPAQFKVRFSS